ncbi:MAG: GyrI-like domain-containing protein [Dermatophilaceae bacterium]|nr:GyrI-like domain-containing protein [Intrasporangiaceae bacterium]
MDTTPELVTLEPTTAAVLRETVPMSELTDFFDRAFHAVMVTVQAQEVAVTGPPFAIYYGMPTDTVDLAVGFPTATPVSPADGVVAAELPGGRAAQLLHVGPYDQLESAYGRVMAWLSEKDHRPADVMWETYLNEPAPDGDPTANQTLITWPIVD